MNRREMLKAAGLGAAAWALPQLRGAAQTGAKPPNIIFILSDDYGIGGVGCYGSDKFKTPQLDAIAAKGLRFEHCFSAPLCAPSRALCMFGRYAFRTGVYDNGCGAAATPDKETCIAKTLKQAGYATAVSGKWQQLQYFTTKEDAAKWGFDEFMIWGVGDAGGSRYYDPTFNLNGKLVEDAKGKFGPDLLQSFAVDFIRRHKDGPFFLYYPMVSVHGPLAKTPDADKNGPDLLGDNIQHQDKLVGNLAAELDALGIRENTLLVFTGDNGLVPLSSVNGKPIDGKKGQLNEGGSRVPLICSWPGTIKPGQVTKDLVDFSDFFATFAELAGAPLPPGVTIDGHSFAPLLKGQPYKSREWVYIQLGAPYYLRTQRYKLTSNGELFDMKDAPHKETLVAADTTDAEAVAARKAMQAALDELRKDAPEFPKAARGAGAGGAAGARRGGGAGARRAGGAGAGGGGGRRNRTQPAPAPAP